MCGKCNSAQCAADCGTQRELVFSIGWSSLYLAFINYTGVKLDLVHCCCRERDYRSGKALDFWSRGKSTKSNRYYICAQSGVHKLKKTETTSTHTTCQKSDIGKFHTEGQKILGVEVQNLVPLNFFPFSPFLVLTEQFFFGGGRFSQPVYGMRRNRPPISPQCFQVQRT